MNCPCGSQKSFAECCEPVIKGSRPAATPEELMRSRYSAYSQRVYDYIVNTTHPQRRYEINHEASREWMENSTFTKLEILRSTNEGNKGVVEFIAHFQQDGKDHSHHEISRFRKQDGVWYFHEGRIVAPANQIR